MIKKKTHLKGRLYSKAMLCACVRVFSNRYRQAGALKWMRFIIIFMKLSEVKPKADIIKLTSNSQPGIIKKQEYQVRDFFFPSSFLSISFQAMWSLLNRNDHHLLLLVHQSNNLGNPSTGFPRFSQPILCLFYYQYDHPAIRLYCRFKWPKADADNVSHVVNVQCCLYATSDHN